MLTHNNTNSFKDNELNSTTTSTLSRFIQINSNHSEILEGEELQERITRTINSKNLIEKLDWSIKGS